MRETDVLELARRYVPGAGPPAVRPVGSGLACTTYRVRRDARRFSLRVAAPGPRGGAFDPVWECEVRKIAGAAGLAPALVDADTEAGILLAEWVDGRCWSEIKSREPANIARIAALIRRIHALPPPQPARIMPPGSWIARYAAILGGGAARTNAIAPALRRKADARLDALEALPAAPPVLCHSDLHVLNVVDTGRALIALDWEYAHVTDPLWDLAGWSRCNDFAVDQSRALAALYFGRPPAPVDRLRFDLLAWLYDYVCLLWSEVYLRQADGADAPILARAQRIRSRLEAAAGGPAAQVPAD